jgi:hypothetical protein
MILIVYAIFAATILIWALISKTHFPINYIRISRETLDDFRQWRDDLVVIELRGIRNGTSSGALTVRPGQLKGLLRWLPRKTMIVLCSASEVAQCRSQIENELARAAIDLVCVLDDDADSLTLSVAPHNTLR